MRRRFRMCSDKGASAIEWAILTPILILVLLLVVQFAMVYHARQVALAAAQSGARVARTQVEGDWQGPAVDKASADIDKIGSNLLAGRQVRPLVNGDQRGIEVSGTAVRVIPFMTFHVTQRSEGPIECFRPDEGAGTACQGAR